MVITPEMMNNNEEEQNLALECCNEWRRCLIWLALQAGMCRDAAILAVFNDMLQDERVIFYYKSFPDFRNQVRRLIKKPEDI